jgi:hypothetical protein
MRERHRNKPVNAKQIGPISGSTSPPGNYPQLINAPGSETGPGPQLVTWGKSTILSVDAHGLKFEYTLNSAKHIPLDWGGPGQIGREKGCIPSR